MKKKNRKTNRFPIFSRLNEVGIKLRLFQNWALTIMRANHTVINMYRQFRYNLKPKINGVLLIVLILIVSCSEEKDIIEPNDPIDLDFYFGADLSYVNQILDKGGIYTDSTVVESPYVTFPQYGANLARFRLWHNPVWVKDVYDDSNTTLYSGYEDVEKSIGLAKSQGMEVLLDFHYSDDWADPGNQKIPAAWSNIRDIDVLSDSVYNYTHKILTSLNAKGLMPEFVQIGNETNCGMLYTNAPTGFPDCEVCDGQWSNFRTVAKSAINAIKNVSGNSDVDTKVIFHIADPVNIDWWFTNLINQGELTDFDIIGFSYYPLWHADVSLGQLESVTSRARQKFDKDLMAMEVAYPWTNQNNDSYNNLFGGTESIPGYPISRTGHRALMRDITQSLINAGAIGLIYWEPAWISSGLKDRWGTGSSWENNSFYEFDGEVNSIIDFMNFDYSTE